MSDPFRYPSDIVHQALSVVSHVEPTVVSYMPGLCFVDVADVPYIGYKIMAWKPYFHISQKAAADGTSISEYCMTAGHRSVEIRLQFNKGLQAFWWSFEYRAYRILVSVIHPVMANLLGTPMNLNYMYIHFC